MGEVINSSTELAHFDMPQLQYNEHGWGPCEIPDTFRDMPYQPFSKSDRLGKTSDWTGSTAVDKKFPNKYASQFGTGSQYAYYHEEDETTFHLVDNARVQKPPHQRGRFRGNMRNMRNMRGRGMRGGLSSGMQSLGKSIKQRDLRRVQTRKYGGRGPPPKIRDASVTVRPDWSIIEEMDFPRLAKLSLPNIKDGEDIATCGALEYYDKSYDRVNVKNERPLQRVDRIFHTVTTTDDPIIRVLTKSVGNVYATDAILATLMCCTRSNYSWDIVIEKIGDKLFLDKRDNTEFDLLTVNETSLEPPQDDVNPLNSPRSLAIEATFINHNFSQQVLKSDGAATGAGKYKFDDPNPFVGDDEEGEVASVAYRYRKFDLKDGISLVVRCEHDAAVQSPTGEVQFLTIKALNEWDSKLANGIEWRQKLDTQRGAVLANELRNNSCKLAKWTVQALLAGSDQMKFGYVSRTHVRDSSRHVILGTQQFKPNEFATQINLSMDNAWGILRCIIDICMKQKDGKYLIMKDPNKPVIRLYDIPDNTFETEGSEESGDEGEAFQPLYQYGNNKRV